MGLLIFTEMREMMKRDRSQSMVIRGDRILLRELSEECGVEGRIVRPLTIEYKPDMESRVFTFLVEIAEDAEPVKGIDPELPENEQSIVAVKWLRLDEIAERDRAYLFGAGLMRIPLFHDEVLLWDGDDISYPVKKVFS